MNTAHRSQNVRNAAGVAGFDLVSVITVTPIGWSLCFSSIAKRLPLLHR